MKRFFSELQYLQIAQEQFSKFFKEIPYILSVDISPSENHRKLFGDFRASVVFKDSAKPLVFNVEVKSNGEKRYVNQFILSASQFKNEDECCVFMAPYFSEESAKCMKDNNFNYMDFSGNCYISFGKVFLYVSGQPNKFIEKREKKNYLSKSSEAASVIMRTMLNEPEKVWQVKTLTEKSGKAIGSVSNVKSFLKDRDWIEEYSSGFKLHNVKEMLYSWAKDYNKSKNRAFEFYSLDSIPALEQKISEWSKKNDNGAVLGGFSAAARYAPVVRYQKIDVYVDSLCFEKFVKEMDLKPVDSGGNVSIIIPHDDTPCTFIETINGSIITCPVQTVLDLLGKAGRGEDAADAMIAKIYGEK